MGADLRVVNHRSAGAEPVADIEVRPAQLQGIRVPRASGAARDRRIPGPVRRGGVRRGRNGRHRRRRAAREGKRPHRRDGGGPDGDGRRPAKCCPTASASRAAGRRCSPAARSTATAITGSRCRSRSRACAPRAPIDILDVAECRDLVPGLPRASRRRRLERRPCGERVTGARPDHHDRRAERLGQGHDLRAGSPTASAGTCSTAARCIGSWPRRPASAASAPTTRPATPTSPQQLDVQFGLAPHGGEQIWLGGRRGQPAHHGPSRPARAPRGSPPCRRSERRCWSASGPLRRPPGLVADGRDMGTVVFPDAALKIFLTASAEERARRRYNQLKDKGLDASLAALSLDIAERDRRDASRAVAPLRPADDARDRGFHGDDDRCGGRASAGAGRSALPAG